ncbi:MAG: hypothetical protein WC897_03935 [Candidatus Gracilibacteria bacterium]
MKKILQILSIIISSFTLCVALASATDEDTAIAIPIDAGDYSALNLACVDGRHEHIHYNTSTDTPTQRFIGVAHEFAIVFEDDFLEHVDTTRLQCSNSEGDEEDDDDVSSYVDCGFNKDTDLGSTVYSESAGKYNGMTVKYQELDFIAGSPRGLLWTYGTNDPTNLDDKPWIGAGGSTAEGINFWLEDYDDEYTVTTTSWTKMEFFYTDPDEDYTDMSKWHHTYTDEVYPFRYILDPDADYIYWYGLNGTTVSNFEACPPPEALACSTLTISPDTLRIDDVFSDTDFTVTATDAEGNDITDESTFTYNARKYGSTFVSPDPADGSIYTGVLFNLFSQGSQDVVTGDSTITYENSEPGDSLYVYVSDYNGVSYPSCNANVEFPYCTDLNILEPDATPSPEFTDTYMTNIEIEAESSTNEKWPFNVTYSSTDADATFDRTHRSPYTTTDWTIDRYVSTNTDGGIAMETVNVDLDDENSDGESDDVAGLCSDEFTYMFLPIIACKSFDITQETITAEQMATGDVEISWTSENTAGTEIAGPYICESTNPAGTFTDSTATSTGTITTNDTTVYYNGTAGDTITCYTEFYGKGNQDGEGNPQCKDTVTSESAPNAPVCELLVFSDTALVTSDHGTTYEEKTFDDTSILDYSTLCMDYNLTVSDPSYTGTIRANAYTDTGMTAYSGTLSLTNDETGGSAVGNPVELAVTGYTSYSGTLCWENYEPENYITIGLIGDEDVCFDSQELPPETTENPFCTDLLLSPDSVVMEMGASTADDIAITTTVTGSASDWSGTLMITKSGAGTLYYADGTASEFSDGHLAIPVYGETNTVTASYTGGVADDIVSAYIEGETNLCADAFPITQPKQDNYCVDLNMSPDSVIMSLDETITGTTSVKVDVTASDLDWSGTLIIARSGVGTLYYADGTASEFSDGHLAIPVLGQTNTLNASYVGGKERDTVMAYIEGEETNCSDNFSVVKPTSANYCIDLNMSPDGISMSLEETITGTTSIKVDVTGSNPDWSGTLIIARSGVGTLYYPDGRTSEFSDGHLSIPVLGQISTLNASYVGGKERDTVMAYIDGEATNCSDNFSITKGEEEEHEGGSEGGGEEDVCEVEVEDDNSYYADETIGSCEDYTIEDVCTGTDDITITAEPEYKICYEDEDGDEDCEYGEIEITADNYCFDVEVHAICEDANVQIEESGDICGEVDLAPQEVGEFNKYIFTFNFSSEKNSYSDEGVFFSHDEDRAFYTLEYDPAGPEDQIVFTDSMWDHNLTGTTGGNFSTTGTVKLATTPTELTSGEAYGEVYTYSTITKFGFGATHEEHSNGMADYVDGLEDFRTFIPYIKYENGHDESEPIGECQYEYDEDSGERTLTTNGVCFDPESTPEGNQKVIIENAGTIKEAYGEDAVIRVRYVGVVNSGIDCASTEDECLTEEFQNEAQLSLYDDTQTLEASARLVVLCSYLITQNSGDVYLEEALHGGSDISCIYTDEGATEGTYHNVDALVILDNGAGTGGDAEGATADGGITYTDATSTTSLCNNDYGSSIVGNLSSYVCEIVSAVSDLWKKSTVESGTTSNLSQATRNVSTNQVASDSEYTSFTELQTALTNKNNPTSGILYFDGNTSDAGKITLGAMEIPSGAYTLVVENANLVLAGNISYSATTDYKNMPSIAFVVTSGDIFINADAHELVGVYYTDQKFDGDERSAVNGDLTIDGSFYGNIQTLLNKAHYVGPPTMDGGSVVIRYDARIILNTPPGLSEYVDIETEKAVN